MKTTRNLSLAVLSLMICYTLFSGCASDNITQVTIDLGFDTIPTPPDDLISISLTVTAPDMDTMDAVIPTDTGKLTIDVSAGDSRVFSVSAEATISPHKIYEGESTADLSPSQSAEISIAMIAKYTSEGSIDSPIYIPRNNFADIHVGRVGMGKSYYYTDGVGDNFFFIYLDALEDDADIIEYGNDNTYTTPVQRPMYGRTMLETISKGGWNGNLYFAIDGSQTNNHTQYEGTAYTIQIVSHNGTVGVFSNEGTVGNPEPIPLIPPGWQYFGMCGSDPGGISYYQATVRADTAYLFHNSNAGVIQRIYSDQFVSEVLSFPYSPSSNSVFISVDGDYTGFQIRIVKNEGSASDPVYLFTDKINYAEVGDPSSYYIFEVTAGNNYDFSVTNVYQDVDLFVFDDINFTNQVGSSENVGNGVDESVSSLGATTNLFGVRIDNKTVNASTFILEVTEN